MGKPQSPGIRVLCKDKEDDRWLAGRVADGRRPDMLVRVTLRAADTPFHPSSAAVAHRVLCGLWPLLYLLWKQKFLK